MAEDSETYDPTNDAADAQEAQSSHSLRGPGYEAPPPPDTEVGSGGGQSSSGSSEDLLPAGNVETMMLDDTASANTAIPTSETGGTFKPPYSAVLKSIGGKALMGAGTMPFLLAHSDGHARMNLNPVFANGAADVFGKLEQAQGGKFKDQFKIVSGSRSEEDQKEIQAEHAVYDAQGKFLRYDKPVGGSDLSKPHSAHLDGNAMDVSFTGDPKDKAAFFAELHKIGAENGMKFVENDINHMQLDTPQANNNVIASNQKSSGLFSSFGF